MRKDPTEFRKRFAAWKAGNKVYEAGLPHFEEGTGKEEKTYDGGSLKEVVVTGYRPIELKTYYPLGKKYPWTGHSKLNIPITQEVADEYGLYGLEESPFKENTLVWVTVDKKPRDRGYNLFTNNCADATLNYLNTAFDTKELPFLFTTPGDVRDYAIDTLGGKKVEGKDGIETILIPRNRKNADTISRRILDLQNAEDLQDKRYTGSRIVFRSQIPHFEEGKEPDYQHSSDFISKYEGWSDTAYQKKGDVPTIGYGTTNPKWVSKGRITRAQGIQAMHEDLAKNEPLLHKNIKDYDRLPDTAKTVLRDILYNVGQGNMFRKSTKFINAMNAGNYEEAARQMDWDENKPGFGGAKIRNRARREMFLQDLKNNPVKPRSLLIQLMYDKSEFQPGFQYTPTILTDYSLTNRAGGKLNAWNGAGSPAYGGVNVLIPSLYLVMEQNLFKPRK